MFLSGLGAAPVPSMICTCSRTTFGVLTVTYLRTCGASTSTAWASAIPAQHSAAALDISVANSTLAAGPLPGVLDLLMHHFYLHGRGCSCRLPPRFAGLSDP